MRMVDLDAVLGTLGVSISKIDRQLWIEPDECRARRLSDTLAGLCQARSLIAALPTVETRDGGEPQAAAIAPLAHLCHYPRPKLTT